METDDRKTLEGLDPNAIKRMWEQLAQNPKRMREQLAQNAANKVADSDVQLDRDMTLNFQSISMLDGHAGYKISYDAAKREAIEHRYCVRVKKRKLPFLKKKTEKQDTVDTLPIPETVTTKQELLDYIRTNRPHWNLSK